MHVFDTTGITRTGVAEVDKAEFLSATLNKIEIRKEKPTYRPPGFWVKFTNYAPSGIGPLGSGLGGRAVATYERPYPANSTAIGNLQTHETDKCKVDYINISLLS